MNGKRVGSTSARAGRRRRRRRRRRKVISVDSGGEACRTEAAPGMFKEKSSSFARRDFFSKEFLSGMSEASASRENDSRQNTDDVIGRRILARLRFSLYQYQFHRRGYRVCSFSEPYSYTRISSASLFPFSLRFSSLLFSLLVSLLSTAPRPLYTSYCTRTRRAI